MRAVGAANYWMNLPAAVEPLRLRRVPLLAVTLCFAAGICVARQWQSPRTLASATLLLFLLTLFGLLRAQRVAFFPALALCIVAGAWCAQIEPPLESHPALLNDADGLSRIVRGSVQRVRLLPAQTTRVDMQPLAPWQIEPGGWDTDSSEPLQSVDIAVRSVEEMTPDTDIMQPMTGGVRVLLTSGALRLRCGDVLEMPLRMRPPDAYRDPGAFSYATQLLIENVDVHASVASPRVSLIAQSSPSLRCRMFAAQTWATAKLDTILNTTSHWHTPGIFRLNNDDEGMLHAMLFGDRAMLSTQLRDSFQQTGTFHLFVVSGLHIALLAAGLFWLLRKIRFTEGFAVLLTLTLAALYTAITGAGVPAQRALLMTSVYLIARWLDREITALNALGFAGLAVLVLEPRALFESSFQMTALVIVAAGGIASPLMERCLSPYASALRHLDIVSIDAFLPPQLAEFRVRLRMAGELCERLIGRPFRNAPARLLRSFLYAAEALVVSFAAELCMSIPMAIYFHRATLLALPLNLLNIPLLALLLCAAMVMFAAALISKWIAFIPAAITALLLHIMRYSVLRLRGMPFADIRVPTPPYLAIAAAGILMALCCFLLRQQNRNWLICGIVGMFIIPVVVFYPTTPKAHFGKLEVTALDVGQGDSLLTVSPTGDTMLIDAGGPTGRATPATWDIGEQIVAPYLWQRGLRKLDVVVLTHAHSDHMGGMPTVLRDFHPRELWLSIEPKDSPSLRTLLDEAQQLRIAVRHLHAGEAFAWSGTNISVLAPEAAYSNSGAPINDDSLVMRMDYDRASVLLEGDAQAASEDTMLANGRLAPVTLLKVGHHGSKTSTTSEFLNAVSPHDAVISVGRHNTFGHPRFDVLERLEAAHVRTYRTDREGAETFLLSADGSIAASSADSTN
jgi:competence protein ComEC